MSTRKHTTRNRGFRPETDALESRRLLSAVVSGTDTKGDAWTLRLIGPGAISVTKQNGADGSPGALTSATDINTITVAGTDPQRSRLVGTVTKGAGSDGRVFFQNLLELPARSERFPGSGTGLLAIDIPNFWLGNTTPTGSTPSSTPSVAIPDGVETLDFGGVDTSVNQITPTATSTSDTALVTLGLPTFGGTRIILDKSVSSTQPNPAATATSGTTTLQHGVVFAVSGRLDLFQANEIDGDAVNPPGQFGDFNAAATGTGGTTLVSTTPGVGGTIAAFASLFPSNQYKGAVTGQIGDVRIGGNATNFSTAVFDGTQSGGDKISNFSIGGETNNILVVAPTGLRNAVFGKGMDTVDILAHVVNTLKANRGAVNSNVTVDRSISRAEFGGDVVGTKILTGYQQNYINILTTVAGSGSSFGAGPRRAAETAERPNGWRHDPARRRERHQLGLRRVGPARQQRLHQVRRPRPTRPAQRPRQLQDRRDDRQYDDRPQHPQAGRLRRARHRVDRPCRPAQRPRSPLLGAEPADQLARYQPSQQLAHQSREHDQNDHRLRHQEGVMTVLQIPSMHASILCRGARRRAPRLFFGESVCRAGSNRPYWRVTYEVRADRV